MGLEVVFHVFNSGHLGSSHLLQVLEQFVMNENLPQLDDLNMIVFGLPDLALG